jgi:hypothetical protein
MDKKLLVNCRRFFKFVQNAIIQCWCHICKRVSHLYVGKMPIDFFYLWLSLYSDSLSNNIAITYLCLDIHVWSALGTEHFVHVDLQYFACFLHLHFHWSRHFTDVRFNISSTLYIGGGCSKLCLRHTVPKWTFRPTVTSSGVWLTFVIRINVVARGIKPNCRLIIKSTCINTYWQTHANAISINRSKLTTLFNRGVKLSIVLCSV